MANIEMATTIENIHERIQNLITKICQERISFNTSNTSNINNDSNRRNLIFVTHNNLNLLYFNIIII